MPNNNNSGKRVLDVACGDGVRTMLYKKYGASKVVGVDISPGMIAIARREAIQENIEIEYVVGDAKDLQIPGEFDFVTSFYLFPYAASRDELLTMCKQIKSKLVPGGKYVGVNQAVKMTPKDLKYCEKYGFFETRPENPQDGDKTTITFNYGIPITANIHYLKPETYEWAFKEAGFTHFEWRPLSLYDNPTPKDQEYYKDILDHPIGVGIIAW
eukprot:Phypoly_transcript_16396.p1 GENE.Phypoly_transcript_16396~~Phypoly_transcript_16396.p1  ORF type:complete len:213 (+),score=24.31 Phypoly_transcript_16396:212-850(+)